MQCSFVLEWSLNMYLFLAEVQRSAKDYVSFTKKYTTRSCWPLKWCGSSLVQDVVAHFDCRAGLFDTDPMKKGVGTAPLGTGESLTQTTNVWGKKGVRFWGCTLCVFSVRKQNMQQNQLTWIFGFNILACENTQIPCGRPPH